jgi:hypothetical protein
MLGQGLLSCKPLLTPAVGITQITQYPCFLSEYKQCTAKTAGSNGFFQENLCITQVLVLCAKGGASMRVG